MNFTSILMPSYKKACGDAIVDEKTPEVLSRTKGQNHEGS